MNPSQEPAPPGAPAPPPPYGARPYDVPLNGTPSPYDDAQPVGAPPPAGFGWYPSGRWPGAGAPRRRPWRRNLAVGALTALTVAAAGIPLGALWSWLAPSVPVVRTRQAGVVVRDPSPEQFVAADGSFTLLGFGFGVLAAIAAWLIVRRHRGPALLTGVVLGALAAAGVAWQVGRRFGLADFAQWQEAAAVGATFDRPPDLHAHGPLLVPAFAAVIVCTLLAGWSNDPDLDVPGARPGYGHDLPVGPHPDQYGGYGISSGSPDGPDRTAAPAPPGSGPATPPHG